MFVLCHYSDVIGGHMYAVFVLQNTANNYQDTNLLPRFDHRLGDGRQIATVDVRPALKLKQTFSKLTCDDFITIRHNALGNCLYRACRRKGNEV